MKISPFNSLYAKLVSLHSEDMTAGMGGVFGAAPSMDHEAGQEQGDFYAPGDARNPYASGTYTRGGKLKKKKKKKSNVKNVKKITIVGDTSL